jgi:hypothetical protein
VEIDTIVAWRRRVLQLRQRHKQPGGTVIEHDVLIALQRVSSGEVITDASSNEDRNTLATRTESRCSIERASRNGKRSFDGFPGRPLRTQDIEGFCQSFAPGLHFFRARYASVSA